MKLVITRAALLKPLQLINGVVERRQTMPILSNILLVAKNEHLSLTGTDLEIEMIGQAPVHSIEEEGATTVSARKLLDICRTLPDDALLQLTLENNHLIVRHQKSRFMLATLPPDDFPDVENVSFLLEFPIKQNRLKKLLSKTYFAMGQEDVRYFLNGALFDVQPGLIKCVATDGHRLALSSMQEDFAVDKKVKVILPRKTVLELVRLLDDSEEEATIFFGENHFRLKTSDMILTSKLINAQYPDYEKLIPRGVDQHAIMSREGIKQALIRASILLNEKIRGVQLQLNSDVMQIMASNPEQEEAEEIVSVQYQGGATEFAFNVAYLLDAVSAIDSDQLQWSFKDPAAGVLIESLEKADNVYLVMPLRL